MFDLTALELARIQFGFTISFHIIFPAITIGLASYLVVLEGLWLWKRDEVYRDLHHFWVKVFAVNFGMGVVSGLVMAYQFGTNWSYFSAFAGGVTGPLLSYEVLTAFFLEAGFLGVMLFGWNRVGPALHFLATIMVSTGTLLSACWILASNSWMQTPRGYEILDGRIVPVDWFQVIFNPSFPYRLTHMAVAAYLTVALIVGASGAWHILRGRDSRRVRTMFSMAMWMILVATPVQIFLGDAQGRNTLQYQPAKIAAIEGHWENTPGQGAPLVLFGLPDMAAETNRYAIEVPHLGSVILTHTWNGQFAALKDFPPEDRPDSTVIFWTFRGMVGLGMLMLLLGLGGAWLRYRGQLYRSRLFLRFAVAMGPTGLIAILAGWVTTEMGRQPWVVYGLLRTKDAVSNHAAATVGATLAVFVVMYFFVFGTGISYMLKLIAVGPDGYGTLSPSGGDDDPLNQRPSRPLSAVPHAGGAAPTVHGPITPTTRA
jgi:cytochrome d ubiquinol oxidase subunit I